MSLNTFEAINSAIADLVNAKLCLIDATDVNVREEVEQIESVTHYLESKLEEVAAKEISENEDRKGE